MLIQDLHRLLLVLLCLSLLAGCGARLQFEDDSRGGSGGIDLGEGASAGECSDGADNDLDGLFDCDDDGCADSIECDDDDDDDND
ncbi:MAG: hypothetical protein CL928_07725, partial [Deltaproteobacteria bacterium]|nr:hypothetical protein [Deltaproteobacteria bacterium]